MRALFVLAPQYGFGLTDGHVTTIDVPGSIATSATGINNGGHIVGTHQFGDSIVHSFLLVDGRYTTIDVPGAWYTVAHGINDAGVIVGEFIDGSGTHGFILIDNHFTTVDVPGSRSTQVLGINASGQLVGGYIDADPGRTHGFGATPAVADKSPPVITVSASPETLWPPNGQRVTVTVLGTITDEPGGLGVSSAVYQVIDEYGQIQPSGDLTLGADGSYAFTVALEASRRGNDQDGRHYTIVVSAQDNLGNPGFASTLVTVPHG